MKSKLKTGSKLVKGEALRLSEDEKKRLALAKAYWQSCQERIQLYQKLDNEKWVFYQ